MGVGVEDNLEEGDELVLAEVIDVACSFTLNSLVSSIYLQCNLQIQFNPYQNSNYIFQRNRKKKRKPKICTEMQKTLNCQSNLEKERSWRYHTP